MCCGKSGRGGMPCTPRGGLEIGLAAAARTAIGWLGVGGREPRRSWLSEGGIGEAIFEAVGAARLSREGGVGLSISIASVFVSEAVLPASLGLDSGLTLLTTSGRGTLSARVNNL